MFSKNIDDITDYNYWLSIPDNGKTQRVICTHVGYITGIPSGGTIGVTTRINNHIMYINFGADIMNAQTSGNTKNGLKEYLTAQYTNGTPVCVWYVLEIPITATVNEPLMKIGDYADSLTTSIPVTAGENTLDVQTTVQPSEVSINYKGWHPVTDVHEKSENLFDKNNAAIGERVLQSSVTADAGTAHSDYIDVTGISTLTVNKKYNATNFYFYADKTNSSIGYVNDFTANVPTGAKYCRINVLKDDVDTIMLNEGNTALPYEPYWT
jgi:hypothetical protein